MPDILHDFPVAAPPARVFDLLASPTGLDAWWTLTAEGRPAVGERYRMYFGDGYEWAGVLRRCERPVAIEWEMTVADADWTGTRVGFTLRPEGDGTRVSFHHTGWPVANDHFRTSSYCWAMYLRLLGKHLETGLVVPYEQRLAV